MEHVARTAGLNTLGGAIWQGSTWRYTRYRAYDNESTTGNNRANAGENWKIFGSILGIQEGEPWHVTYFSLISVPGVNDVPRVYMQFFNVVPGVVNGMSALNLKGNRHARNFLTAILNAGECRKRIETLINKFAEVTGVDPIETNLEKVFDRLLQQRKGGITLNIPQSVSLDSLMAEKKIADWNGYFSPYSGPPRPAMGLATRVFSSPLQGRNFNNEGYLLLQNTPFNPQYGETNRYTAANILGQRFIHELLHLSASAGTYSHDDDARILEGMKSLGENSVADYLSKYCRLPKW